MYYLNILYCNVLSEDSCPASALCSVVVRQPLKSSVTWIIPKSRYLKSHILNCTIIVSTVKYEVITS